MIEGFENRARESGHDSKGIESFHGFIKITIKTSTMKFQNLISHI